MKTATARQPHGGLHPCSVCGKPVPRGRLMCAPHWRLVPLPLQREVWAAWGSFQAAESAHRSLRCMALYRKAADAATAWVAEAQPPFKPVPTPTTTEGTP